MHQESEEVVTAIGFLAARGVPETAREFRLRQEFFRHGWDIRVREDHDGWIVHAIKHDREEILKQASTEGDVLRIALMAAILADDPTHSR
ncbi:hypothetical protein BH23CHL5_BH23CHL5_17640 [soil metagenome]